MENYSFTYTNGTTNTTQDWTVGEGDYFPLSSGNSQSNQASFDTGSQLPITVAVGDNSTSTELTLGHSGWTMQANPAFTLAQANNNVTVTCSYTGTDGQQNPHKHHHHRHAK